MGPYLGRHGLDRDLLPRQDGAQARERGQRRREEGQEVDGQGRWGGHGDRSPRQHVRYGFVVRERHRQRAGRRGVAAQQRQRQHGRVPRECFDRGHCAWVGGRSEQAGGPVTKEPGVEFQQGAGRFGRVVQESGFQLVEQ